MIGFCLPTRSGESSSPECSSLHHQPRRSLAHVSTSPTQSRKLTRPPSRTSSSNGHSISTHDLHYHSSTSPPNSLLSVHLSAAPIQPASTTANSAERFCNSISSNHHSQLPPSLSNSHSLGSFHSVSLAPDRNNNIKGLVPNRNGQAKFTAANNSAKQTNVRPRQHSLTPGDAGSLSRIPKSKLAASPMRKVAAVQSSGYGLCTEPKSLNSVNKLRSTSTLAIPQLSSATSMLSLTSHIPSALPSSSKVRSPSIGSTPHSRYSSHNIYQAASAANDKQRKKLASPCPSPQHRQHKNSIPVANTPFVYSSIQKSSADLSKHPGSQARLDKVPNYLSKSQKNLFQPAKHERKHSASSLSLIPKCTDLSARPPANGNNGSHHVSPGTGAPSQLRPASKQSHGSVSSLNFTDSALSGDVSSSDGSTGNLNESIPTGSSSSSGAHSRLPIGNGSTLDGQTSQPCPSTGNVNGCSQDCSPISLAGKSSFSITNIKPATTPSHKPVALKSDGVGVMGPGHSGLVDVCSWLERTAN